MHIPKNYVQTPNGLKHDYRADYLELYGQGDKRVPLGSPGIKDIRPKGNQTEIGEALLAASEEARAIGNGHSDITREQLNRYVPGFGL